VVALNTLRHSLTVLSLHRDASFRIHVQGQGLHSASHTLCTSKPRNENPALAYCAPPDGLCDAVPNIRLTDVPQRGQFPEAIRRPESVVFTKPSKSTLPLQEMQ
jgi:hypothetical protein